MFDPTWMLWSKSDCGWVLIRPAASSMLMSRIGEVLMAPVLKYALLATS